MAAGLGFKTFTTGEVLTAADTNGYLMQGILVFASAAARDAAITSPQEGQFAYLKDTNVTTYYTGSAWANVDTTGMTNPMTTTGDIIYSSPGSTPVRLAIGTANQVLQVNSGATAPEWVTTSSGGMTLLATTTLSGSSVTVSSISGSYTQLFLVLQNVYGSGTLDLRFRFNSDTSTANYYYSVMVQENGTYLNERNASGGYLQGGKIPTTNTQLNNLNGSMLIPNYTSTGSKYVTHNTLSLTANTYQTTGSGLYIGGSAISSITILNSAGSFTAGTVYTYGVK